LVLKFTAFTGPTNGRDGLMATGSFGRTSRVIVMLLALGIGSSLAVWIGSSVHAAPQVRESGETPTLVRWDVARCAGVSCAALVVGGHAKWRSASGATIKFTGSGEAEPPEGETAGGGVWKRRNSSGQTVGRGVYQAIDFISWRGFGGSLGNVEDAIGHRRDVRSGVLKLRIHLFGTGRGRLVLSSSSAGGTVPRGSLVLHTRSGRRIEYLQKVRPRGQILFHHTR
jgi:hypothetical protein